MKNGKVNGKAPSKSKKTIRVNFSGVSVRQTAPEGWHHVKVAEVSQEEGNKADYLKWTFEIMATDKTNGNKLWTNTSLTPQSLWNLRGLLEALGVDTPESEVDLDLDEYVGLECMVRVEHEEFEGKTRAKVTDYSTLEESATAEDDEEDEEKAEEEEADEEAAEEEEVKVTADEIRELDDGELKDFVKTHSLKVKLEKYPKASKRIAAVIDAAEAAGILAE